MPGQGKTSRTWKVEEQCTKGFDHLLCAVSTHEGNMQPAVHCQSAERQWPAGVGFRPAITTPSHTAIRDLSGSSGTTAWQVQLTVVAGLASAAGSGALASKSPGDLEHAA